MGGKSFEGKAVIFIDGGYLSKVVKTLGGGKYFSYRIQTLAINLAQKLGFWCDEVVFYDSPPFQSNTPSQDERRRKEGYDKMVEKMRRGGMPVVKIREGRLQKINGVFKQKGVDTLITFDLLRYAQIRRYEAIILVSADSDFVPIIKELKIMYPTKLFLAFYTDLNRKSSFSRSNELWTAFEKNLIRIERSDFSKLEK